MNLLIRDADLEANYVPVLYFALGHGAPHLHEFNHARFDFLGKDAELARHVSGNTQFVTS